MAVPRSLFAAGVVALAALSQGCLIQTNYTAYNDALQPVEQVAVGIPARAKVYVFLMTGADTLDVGGMKELGCELVRAGFPKVYYAQRFDGEWYYKEVHRLHRTDPDNRFVFVGEGAAAKQVRELACRVTADNIPLDAVVYLDPAGVRGDLDPDPAYPTKVIRSHHWVGSPRLQTPDLTVVERVGHFHLPNHPSSVAAIVDILIDSARRVPIPCQPVDCVPVLDEHKPIPRPYEPKLVPPAPPGWNVLCPESGQG